MEIGSSSLGEFRKDFAEAVRGLEEKYGVKISIGNIRYNKDQFHTTMTVDNGRDPEVIAANRFDRDVLKYAGTGLKPGMYRQVIECRDGKRYAVLGFNTKAPTYPIQVVSIPDGHRYKIPTGFIKTVLNEKYQQNMAGGSDDDAEEIL